MSKAVFWIALTVNFIAVIGCCVLSRVVSAETRGWEWAGPLLLMLYPLLNLIAICPPVSGDSWISLYIQRKKAEERKRIRELQPNDPCARPVDLPMIGKP